MTCYFDESVLRTKEDYAKTSVYEFGWFMQRLPYMSLVGLCMEFR